MTNNQQTDQNTQTSQAKPELPAEEATQQQGVPTVLIVEDDPVLAKMYTEKFKHEGLKVLVASNGELGLRMALEEKINIILLDIMLPKLSGTDLLVKLRADPRGKDIPVVALSNLAEQAEKDKVLSYGAKEYLVKAMQTPEQVVEKIKKYMLK